MDIELLQKILAPVFERWGVPLAKTIWSPALNTDDFGLRFSSLLLAKEIDQRVSNPFKSMIAGKIIWEGITFKYISQNLKALSKKLGFAIRETSSFYYVRDIFLRFTDGSIGYCPHSSHLKTAIECVHSSNLYLDKGTTTRTRNQLFNHWTGYTNHYYPQALKDLQTYFPGNYHPFSNVYLEGGNVFRLTNVNGKEVVLIGEDHYKHTLLLLELEKKNWESLAQEVSLGYSFEKGTAKLASELSAEEIQRHAEEMYSLGLLLYHGKTGLIEENNQLNILLTKFFIPGLKGRTISEEERGWFRDLAIRSGALKPFRLAPSEIERARLPVAGYLTKLEIVHALMAQACRVSKENLHFITQANYHLDAFLQPAPHHGVFLVDFAFASELLEAIYTSQLRFNLSDKDLALLKDYIETSKKFASEFNDLLTSVKIQLEAAGLVVLPCPGHFLYEPSDLYEKFPIPSEGLCINFINALTGYSDNIQAPFYITHGIHAGEQIGSLLMDSFSLFLRTYIPNISTFYMGYNPYLPNDFSESLDFWNRIETQSGIHCMTIFLPE